MADLSVKRLGLSNPFVIAASPATHGVQAVLKSARVKPGAIVMRNPRHSRGGGNLFLPSAQAVLAGKDAIQIHAYGKRIGDWFASFEEFFEGVVRARREMPSEVRLWVSISAMWETISHPWEEEWVKQAKAAQEAGADAVELHFNTPGTVALRIFDLGRWVYEATKLIKSKVRIPVMVKLPVEGFDPVLLMEAASHAGADGVGPTGRWRGLVFDLDLKIGPARPGGGYSGTQILPIMCWIAFEAKQAGIETPMFAGGGVFSWEGAAKLIMAGSDAVQLGSIACGLGPTAVERMTKQLSKWMDENGYPDLDSMRGKVRDMFDRMAKAPEPQEIYTAAYKATQVAAAKCINCGMCEDACWFDSIDRRSGKARKTDACLGCGYCFQVCPTGALAVPSDEIQSRIKQAEEK